MAAKCSRIEFCGGIGAGKSTVARLLAAHYGLPLIKEHYEGIPFWEDFYRDPLSYELEKNISFMLFHGNAIRLGAAQGHIEPMVCDFALFQDLAYAAMSRLSGDYGAIVAVHERLIVRLAPPDLVIHVRCPVDEQLARIRKRARTPELAISRAYLEDLSASIDAELARQTSAVPIIDVDTGLLDFVGDPSSGLAALSRAFERWLEPVRTSTAAQ